MATPLNIKHTKVTPESKATPRPHPAVGRGLPNGSTMPAMKNQAPVLAPFLQKSVNTNKSKTVFSGSRPK